MSISKGQGEFAFLRLVFQALEERFNAYILGFTDISKIVFAAMEAFRTFHSIYDFFYLFSVLLVHLVSSLYYDFAATIREIAVGVKLKNYIGILSA